MPSNPIFQVLKDQSFDSVVVPPPNVFRIEKYYLTWPVSSCHKDYKQWNCVPLIILLEEVGKPKLLAHLVNECSTLGNKEKGIDVQ